MIRSGRAAVTPERLVGVLALALCFATVACGGGKQEALERARQDVRTFQEQLQALTQAQQQNDAKAMAAAEAAAMEALRDARENFREAGAQTSRDPQVIREYADVLARLGDVDLMARALQRLVQIDPTNVAAWVSLGQALAALGHDHATEAVEALRHGLDLAVEPRTVAAAHAALGNLYLEERLYDLARRHHDEALKADPNHVESRLAIASLDIREGRMKEAAAAMQTLGDAPLPPSATADIARALADFLEARRTFPDDAESHLAYAQLLIRGNRMPESVWPLDRTVELNPDNYIAWNMLGSVRQALGQNDLARAAFERSLQIKPDQPRTRESLNELAQQPPALLRAPAPQGME